MNRPLLIAAFGFLLASAPLLAQHGGGHASAGGHGGFSSHSSSGHGFSGSSGSHAFSGGSHSGAVGARSYNRGWVSSRGFNQNGRFRNHGFRHNCYGYPCRGVYGYGYGYPWYGYPLYGGFYNPYWWDDSGSSYDPDQQYETGLANEMNQQSLEEQRMREQSEQDPYEAAAPPRPRHQQATDAAQTLPATVLVFRDQHRAEVQNYAIVGQTLWNFAPGQTQKIPLSDLDVPATTKANDERGVSFRVPGANEGQ